MTCQGASNSNQAHWRRRWESVKFSITPARREAIDNLIRAEVKKRFGHVVAIEAALDHRYSNREGNKEKKIAGWGGYERYMLAGGLHRLRRAN